MSIASVLSIYVVCFLSQVIINGHARCAAFKFAPSCPDCSRKKACEAASNVCDS